MSILQVKGVRLRTPFFSCKFQSNLYKISPGEWSCDSMKYVVQATRRNHRGAQAKATFWKELAARWKCDVHSLKFSAPVPASASFSCCKK